MQFASARTLDADRHVVRVGRIEGVGFNAGDTQIVIMDRQLSGSTLPENLLRCEPGKLQSIGDEDVQALLKWIRPVPTSMELENEAAADCRCRAAIESWRGSFNFVEQQGDPSNGGTPGLRSPQLGAIHAALAHWRSSNDPATVVMPTGTGKTETMLALLVEQAIERLLVVVPTDPLRDQIGAKFETLGKLMEMGALNQEVLLPVVGRLRTIPTSVEAARTLVRRCNVVVTTMPIMGQCSAEVQAAIAETCTHLFIDEAHHIAAPTWATFRKTFSARRVLQFTATPFRTDGQLVDGRVIFNFPMRLAQEQGYFSVINFKPVTEFFQSDGDRAIAEAAVAQLDSDLAAHDHLVMARTSTVKRAEEIIGLYRELAPTHNPRLIHSGLSPTERREALAAIRARESRIVVCVNMLGEGFDLPNLKIAALHDVHKSLAITLQFAGRFTRAVSGLGEATAIANLGDTDVEDALYDLYAEQSDWNVVLRRLSEGATTAQRQRSEFLSGFTEGPVQVPLQNVFPKMSAVVYKTTCTAWQPSRLAAAIGERNLLAQPSVNPRDKVMVAFTKYSEPVGWGNIKDLRNVSHDLIILYWDQPRGLLFINTSDNSMAHKHLAQTLCGDSATLLRGDQVFRIFSGVTRLVLMNLGLGHSMGKAVSYTMYVGADILEGLATATLRNKRKSNLFARGYETGSKATYGSSHRGRVWSHKVAKDIGDWKRWCDGVGTKLLDDTISVDRLIQGALRFTAVSDRPPGYPIAVEWPEDLYQRSEELVSFEAAGQDAGLLDSSLEIVDASDDAPIRFALKTPRWTINYEIQLSDNGVRYQFQGAVGATVRFGQRSLPVGDWLESQPPIIRFADGGMLVANQYSPGPTDVDPYDGNRIRVFDWTGTDLRKESQTTTRRADSIQHRVIQTVSANTWPIAYDIIFDDDDAFEAADVVAIKVDGDRLLVDLFHLKYSQSAEAGQRVKDLYEVCGQAQRSVVWRGEDPVRLFDHLRHREGQRLRRGDPTRFERGDLRTVHDIRRRARQLTPEYRVFIVQPGVSKAQVTPDQLHLLGATELFLRETFSIPLLVVCSP